MLLNVNVKNLALIKEQDIYFKDGMNILTGETGAGKSIIIGSINIALGQKVNKEMIRDDSESAGVELVFQVEREDTVKALKEQDIEVNDGQVIISRKIINGRSITKVNGDTISAGKLRDITGLLIDIHGQHDHQSLLNADRHIELLDEFAKNDIEKEKNVVAEAYKQYMNAKRELEKFDMDEEGRIRQLEFLKFEIDEITGANLREGEDGELEEEYKRVSNSQKIMEALSSASAMLEGDMNSSVSSSIGQMVKEIGQVTSYDKGIEDIYNQLIEIEALCNDVGRDINSLAEDCTFDPGRTNELEERLFVINHLKQKYGNSIQDIKAYCEEKEKEAALLENYDAEKKEAEHTLESCKKKLDEACDALTEKRKKSAAQFEKRVVETLEELNFLQVKFNVDFSKKDKYTANGNDKVEFLISTNPGEPVRQLAKIASGGELSRIMLGIKTIMAEKDHIETLIFDEIDTGISGRTAQKVAEQMKMLSKTHQIICITHLPQIASMADCHFKIEKEVNNKETVTNIYELDYDNSVNELARMLGGVEITDAVVENAKEMKKLASEK